LIKNRFVEKQAQQWAFALAGSCDPWISSTQSCAPAADLLG
jgi:hypothetical protein